MLGKACESTALEDVYEEIFHTHHGYIFRFVYWRAMNVSIAEDVTQEVFLRAWRYIEKLSHHPQVRGWLVKTTKTVISEYVNARLRQDASFAEMANQMETELRASSDSTPEFLNDLSAQDLLILQMMFRDDMPLSQVSQELDITLSAAKKRSSRAQKRLFALAVEKNYIRKYSGKVTFCYFFLLIYTRGLFGYE